MANVDGQWDCKAKTPMGEQTFVLTVQSDGARFTGGVAGELGSMDITDGAVEGSMLRWTMDIKVPMSLRLNCKAIISGDALGGGVTAGAFGNFTMSGKRMG